MVKSKIGVGIIGLSAKGHWASTAHVPALRAIPEFELRALTASTQESAREAAEKFDVDFYSDNAKELVNNPEVDLVIVAVKLPMHRELVSAALRAKKMVYCEWPLGNGMEESARMVELAAKADVKTFIGLQARSAPNVRYLSDLIKNDFVGEVMSTSIIASVGPPWDGTILPRSLYLLDKKNGATMLSIPFAHTVDAFSMILGRFSEVSANLGVRQPKAKVVGKDEWLDMTSPDQLVVNGVLENGAFASIHYRGKFSRGNNFYWEINGTKGDLIIKGESGHFQYGQFLIWGASGEQKTLVEHKVPESYFKLDVPQNERAFTVAHALCSVRDDIINDTQITPDFVHSLEVQRFIDAVGSAADTGQRHYYCKNNGSYTVR